MPEPLRKYMPGAPEFIPFTKELPKDTTSAKWAKSEKAQKPKKAPAAGGADAAAPAEELKGLKV